MNIWIIEPRTMRFVEARDRIEDLADELSKFLDNEPRRFFKEYTDKYEYKHYNPDNPECDEITEIKRRLLSICEYIDDDVLPTYRSR